MRVARCTKAPHRPVGQHHTNVGQWAYMDREARHENNHLSVKLINEELSTLSESTYDIVILGAGSGGYATALRAAQLGMTVALIDGDKVGGTCLHRGCIPTKAYLHAAETAEAVRESAKFGVNSTFNGIDMAQVGKYRDSVISGLYKGLQGLLKSRKVELISGWGRLADANTVEVNGQRITGRNIVLATGSYSRSIPGLDIGGRIISSDQALQMDWVPSSAVILGGGVIGLEFASVWRSFGAEVTIIEALPHLANNEDEAISKQLERAYRKRGIKFHTNTRFASATQSEQGVHVATEDGKTFDADVLLVAVGRGPVTEGLGYEQVGITLDRGFVITNDRLHTGVGNIYAVGDIVPGLDGYATQGDNVTTVMFRDYEATCDVSDPVPCSHSASVYVDEIRSSLSAAAASSDPGLGALAAAEARRTQALGLTERTQTTIHHYQTRRITDK